MTNVFPVIAVYLMCAFIHNFKCMEFLVCFFFFFFFFFFVSFLCDSLQWLEVQLA